MRVEAGGGEHHPGMSRGESEGLLGTGGVGAGAHQPGHPGGGGPGQQLLRAPRREVQVAVAVDPGGHAVMRGNRGGALRTGRPPG